MSDATTSPIPTNVYWVQTNLPWSFHGISKNFVPLNQIASREQYHAAFVPVVKGMQEEIMQADKRGAPKALTREEAAELSSKRQNDRGQSSSSDSQRVIMVAVQVLRAPDGAYLDASEMKLWLPATTGRFAAFPWDIVWSVSLEQGTTVAERIRGAPTSRDAGALVLLYSIWDTEPIENSFFAPTTAPSNMYGTQGDLFRPADNPWSFSTQEKDPLSIADMIGDGPFPENFSQVYQWMLESVTESDQRAPPEPITLETALARNRLRDEGKRPDELGQQLVISVFFSGVPAGAQIATPNFGIRFPVKPGTCYAMTFNTSWFLALLDKDKPLALAQHASQRSTSSSSRERGPGEWTMFYCLWDTTVVPRVPDGRMHPTSQR